MPDPRDDAARAAHLRQLIAARGRTRGLQHESLRPETVDPGATPDAGAVVDRVGDTLARAPERAANSDDYDRALRIFLEQTGQTLRKSDDEPADARDLFVMEAVIRTDGTRPALLLTDDGAVDDTHPMAETWHDSLVGAATNIRACADSICRIEPAFPTAANVFGTGTLVAAPAGGRGLVLTNWHVVAAMRQTLPGSVTPTATGFTVSDGVFVDFLAEANAAGKRRFKVIDATPSGIDGGGFAKLDAAVLTIEPIPGESPALPQPLTIKADVAGPRGQRPSICLIGYPGQPQFLGGLHDGVDWTWVTTTLFGGLFGVKRISPGLAHRPLGSFTGDARPWIFGHDTTTLGGSSGSPAIAWLEGVPFVFGLHFAGNTMDTNCAHAVASCKTELARLGVPVV
jgi:hypothetical protein